jgi:hypothetical protein
MQMQQQMEQMQQQMEGLQKENSNLRTSATQMSHALTNINAIRGGGTIDQGTPTKIAEAGGGPTTIGAAAEVGRQSLMEPSYEE